MVHPSTAPGFLRTHLWLPLAAGLAVLAALVAFDGDRRIAETLFFSEATQHWIGRGNFWMNGFLHTGGRDLMRLVGVLAIVGWAASFRSARLQPHRRRLGYLALCMALVPLTVGALKEMTNVDCPWDLQGFGGSRPNVEWFEDRPDGLPDAACFPGAHSSSAFALFSLYFLALGGSLLRARLALGGVALLGGAFSIAQQSRGAHFLSHDLVSALIAWLMCLGFYLRFLAKPGKPDAPNP
ncbi:MAG: phosphatase PAP2 family protein [Gammaproteobacteria bacterium]|nr:phosphatase PAP2 family protein [Gammaproteobacteria bacterium]